jgi:hypothetical protein
MSERVRVRSCPENRNVRFFPVSQARAASTSTANGSPGRVLGCGRPIDAAAAEDMETISVQVRFHSSLRERSKRHHSAMATC